VAQIVLVLSSCVILEGLVSTIELLTDVCQSVLMETVCEVCIMVAASYCNLPGVLFMMEVYFCSKNSTHYSEIQSAILQTHVSHLHSAMSHTNSHSCSQKLSKHTREIHRWAIGPLAWQSSTSAYSPSLNCHLLAPMMDCLHRPL
jgi:hypothetical protein